jgi:hypothetical protein
MLWKLHIILRSFGFYRSYFVFLSHLFNIGNRPQHPQQEATALIEYRKKSAGGVQILPSTLGGYPSRSAGTLGSISGFAKNHEKARIPLRNPG